MSKVSATVKPQALNVLQTKVVDPGKSVGLNVGRNWKYGIGN
jgi:hypothetical protein